MRTIKHSLFLRFAAQADEADLVGKDSIADSLTSKLDLYKDNVRDDDENYTYSRDDFEKDVNECLWEIAVRFADFYDCSFDAEKVEELLEAKSIEFINDLAGCLGVEDAVGAHEPAVPGEAKSDGALEVAEPIDDGTVDKDEEPDEDEEKHLSDRDEDVIEI